MSLAHNSHIRRPAMLCILYACLTMILLSATPAKSAGHPTPGFGAVMDTCLQLLDAGQALSSTPALGRLGFSPVASSNPYGGEYAIGPSARATEILNLEAQGLREKSQYTFRPALKGYVSPAAAYGQEATWTISPVTHGSDGQGPGFFILYPERSLSREEVEFIFGEMQRKATSWNNSMISNTTWVYDCIQPGGNRISCYYGLDGQGRYQASFIFRKSAQVIRQPLRDRGAGPHKANSPGGFLRGVGF